MECLSATGRESDGLSTEVQPSTDEERTVVAFSLARMWVVDEDACEGVAHEQSAVFWRCPSDSSRLRAACSHLEAIVPFVSDAGFLELQSHPHDYRAARVDAVREVSEREFLSLAWLALGDGCVNLRRQVEHPPFNVVLIVKEAGDGFVEDAKGGFARRVTHKGPVGIAPDQTAALVI
jgi:hypothetical protein